MTDTPDERPRPTPRPSPHARSGAGPRPSPRPRVAGSRRDREDSEAAKSVPTPAAVPAARKATGAGSAAPSRAASSRSTSTLSTSTLSRSTDSTIGRTGRRFSALVLVLALLCALAAAGAGVLLWQRTHPAYVDSSVFSATRSGIQALYAYDYRKSEESIDAKLAVLTGDLREQYENDLAQGGIIDTYEQVSATTSYEVVDVGLQQINEAQDSATLVVFGQYVVESATSGQEPAPEGSECLVTAEGAQSCTQTVQVGVVRVAGEWKISELTLLTTS
jgi:co-chaperonin GroES (HSP10)